MWKAKTPAVSWRGWNMTSLLCFFSFVLWVLFCVFDSPVFCLPCFLFYFESLPCPHGVYLHFPSVHLPKRLHLPLICSVVYFSPVFPFLFAGWSFYFLQCLCPSSFPVPSLLLRHRSEAPTKFGLSRVNKPPFEYTPAFWVLLTSKRDR